MWFSTVVGVPCCWRMYWGHVLWWPSASRINSANASRTYGSWLCIRRCRGAAVCAMYALRRKWSVLSPYYGADTQRMVPGRDIGRWPWMVHARRTRGDGALQHFLWLCRV